MGLGFAAEGAETKERTEMPIGFRFHSAALSWPGARDTRAASNS
jgi:hypothetical protein